MPKTIISDTSILIIFNKIDEMEILHQLYKEVLITNEIKNEFGETTPEWIKVHKVKDIRYQKLLETQLDVGEASAFALASEFEDVLVLLDDLKARKLANALNIKITGTLGIITKAKQLSIIYEVKPILDKIQKSNFRISQELLEEVLRINKENNTHYK